MPDGLICSVCDAREFNDTKVLWSELIAEWQLTKAEVDYIDRQQGCHCAACGTNLRGNALGHAIRQAMGTNLGLQAAIQSGAFDNWRVLDLNGLPGGLSVILQSLPHYVRRDFPEIDIHRLPFDDGSFDLVLHSDTLEHVAVPVLALQECRRVLVPGRRLCFTAPIIVGRLTRSRAGLPPSYHGLPGENAGDFIVHHEFGADLWTIVFEAGFSDLAMSQVAYPSGIAISAWDRGVES